MKMMEYAGEREAVRAVVKYGEKFGYGNLIDRLQVAWAAKLLRKYPDFEIETAMRGAFLEDERIERLKDMDRDKFLKIADEHTFQDEGC